MGRRSVILYVHCVLHCLCSQEVENGIVRSESELMLCLAFLAGVLSLLYVQGEHVHLAGPRQVGPAIYLILYTAEP